MLNIHYSIKIEDLVTDFEKTVLDSKIWTNPFAPPLVIFSDAKIEQWFKLHIISKKNDSVLMNLKTEKLEGLIFNSLSKGIPFDEDNRIWYEKLDSQVLQSLILNKLISKTEDGTPYYKQLENQDNKDISTYIENKKDGSINQNNLYNFSMNLAQVFTEYMDSRNDDLENGIHTAWDADELFFKFIEDDTNKKEQLIGMEKWQMKLYKELLCENPLTIKSESDDGYVVKYVTLSQLVKLNKQNNNGELKFGKLNQNIFMFGFNSLGRLFRSILCEIAKDTNLTVYLQTVDVEEQDLKNSLLQKWNRAGGVNFSLWHNKADGSIVPVFDDKKTTGTLLSEIQNQIAGNTYDESEFEALLQKQDNSITITGAPSKLKEIEALHSSICNIIKQNKMANPPVPVSYADFIVLAPNIQDYKVPVMQIFEQQEKDSKKKDDNKSNIEFPYLPYVFSDFSGENSAVEEAIGIFISILKKKALYRTDLFTLLRNPVIKKARNFSEEELSAWSNWVKNLNGFRNGETRPEEWKTLRNRLLISVLTEENFSVNDTIYKPYSDMESQTNTCLFKFVDAVDMLEEWRITFGEKPQLNNDDIQKVQDFLAYWLTLPADDKDGFAGERVVYSAVKSEIQNQKILLSAGYESINADSFFMSLKANAKGAKGNGSNLYVGGITFSKLTQNRTIPAKYVYILGMDSKSFPGKDSDLSIDLRVKSEPQPEDATISERNKQAFLCQLMAASEKLSISFVDKDLKKDEDFFQSSVVDDLLAFINADKSFIRKFSIDEVRNWDELFTQRSFRNKTNFKDVMKVKNNQQNSNADESSVCPQRVALSEMKTFLNNPFIFQAGRFFDVDDDEEGKNESKMYEPIELDHLPKSKLLSEVVIEALRMIQENATSPNAGQIQNLINERVQQKVEDLKLQHLISDNVFGETETSKLREGIFAIVKIVDDLFNLSLGENKFQFEQSIHLGLSDKEKTFNTELTGNLCPYIFDKAKKEISILDFLFSKGVNTKNKLKLYLNAIAKIAEEATGDDAISVNLYFCYLTKDEKWTCDCFKANCGFTQESAQKILNNILTNMYIKPYKKMLLVNKTDSAGIKTNYDTFGKFLEAVDNDSTWNYFSKKELFNPFKDFGLPIDAFQNDSNGSNYYKKEINKWMDFVPGLF